MIDAPTLWQLLEQRAAATPGALAALDEDDRRLDFAALRDAALRCAAGLAELGVRPGTPVSWQLPTWLESLALTLALARLGALQNPLLPIYRQRELGFVVGQLAPKLLLVPKTWRGFDHTGLAHEIAAAQPGLAVHVVDRALPDADPAGLPALAASAAAPADVGAARSRARPDAPPLRWLFTTSGTTADPKGVLHSDTTLLAAARALRERLELAEDDRVALVFPVTHVGGIVWLAAGLQVGCAQIAVAQFDPATTPDVLARHGVTQATAGTVFHQAYLAAQRARGPARIFPRVRAFPGGGAPKPPGLHHDVRRELGGVGIVSGYGLTECPLATMGSVQDPDDALATTEGRPTPGVALRVVRPDGTRAAASETGEIRLRAPQLFHGYLDPALDADAFDADNFFRTGDLGHLDARGHLVVSGRLKDVIIRKGENISAKEVEDELHAHPRVAEAALVGLPDAETGERACAVVACHPGAEPLGFDEMVRFLAGRGLMRQKIPERLELVPALPRNPSGKVLKAELRKRYAGG